uniref:Uncharacterized protein n=1 Tax=Mycena chlorophos TaxID=658473 RepID=A0ABQ0LDH0_MYCCL|nr:predicted protein [Mycena chlorophos]
MCYLPLVRATDNAFTLVRPCFCPLDIDESTSDFSHNHNVAAVLPANMPTLCGPLAVFKHAPVDDPDVENGRLLILDMAAADWEMVHSIVAHFVKDTIALQLPPNSFALPPPMSYNDPHTAQSSS